MIYITLDEFKNFLGIPLADTSQDAILQTTLDRSQAGIDKYLGWNVGKAERTEYIQADGEKSLVLLYLPIDSTTAIITDSESGAVYEVRRADEKNGILHMVYELSGEMKAVYMAGYITTPEDLKQATLLYNQVAYRQYIIGTEREIKKKKIDTLEIGYFSDNESAGSGAGSGNPANDYMYTLNCYRLSRNTLLS